VDAEKELDAELYGESVVALAAADLLDGQVGMSGEFVYPPDAGEKAPQGKLTFDRFGEVPFSTNALASDVAVEGWNGVWVPKRSVHLVGVGQVGSMRVVHEAILSLDQFPFAVASAGKVKGSALDVYSVSSLEALAGGVTEDEKQPGNVVSNDGSSTAVELGADTEVTGDVRTAGRVSLSPGAAVLGEVKEGQTAQNLPILDLSVYDPAAGQQSFVPYTPTMTEIKDGKARATGPLMVGDLHLNSGLLYVEGDLTITGKVTGNGAIVCTGGVTVTGQMNLTSDLVALVAGGNVLIDGRGLDAGGTRMQGLVYTNGSFKAEDSTVVGAIVSAQVDGTTQLDRVNLIQVPGATNFEVVVDAAMDEITIEGEAQRRGFDIGIAFQGTFIPFEDATAPALRELASRLVTLPANERGTVQARRQSDQVVVPVGELGAAESNFYLKVDKWGDYLELVANNTVERTEIFKLDLNSFLSVQGELEVLLWKSYRQRVKEQDES
jgi:cytoskeletal protein CcmA (bactofilin family)